jgi:hypothetical protein
VWLTLEADNGDKTKVDMNSVEPIGNGWSAVVVYLSLVPGEMFDPGKLKRFAFDCGGHYTDMSDMSISMSAPPRSVAGRISQLACARAQEKRADMSANAPPSTAPRPEDYCVGFSASACGRMKAIVESKRTPTYCKPGFALGGSGLDQEQLRICYVMTGAD